VVQAGGWTQAACPRLWFGPGRVAGPLKPRKKATHRVTLAALSASPLEPRRRTLGPAAGSLGYLIGVFWLATATHLPARFS
jgi:hypothetical protein